VDVKARAGSQPAPDARGLVRAVVVEDEMDVQLVGHLRFNGLQASEELLTAMASMTLADDGPGRDIECRKQGVVPWRS
jgi:hypothetical protein